MACAKRGKEVCLCGNKAIKWKLSGWVCERCDRIENMSCEDLPRKEKKAIMHKKIFNLSFSGYPELR